MAAHAAADPAPLAGVTVVALEQAVSAPMCTRTTAQVAGVAALTTTGVVGGL
ncbi:CoA transferase, partial [Nocardia sp. NPDC060220]